MVGTVTGIEEFLIRCLKRTQLYVGSGSGFISLLKHACFREPNNGYFPVFSVYSSRDFKH